MAEGGSSEMPPPEQPQDPESRGSGGERDDDFGYGLFPERSRGGGKKQQSMLYKAVFTRNHKCQVMLQIALESTLFSKIDTSHVKSVMGVSVEDSILQHHR
uniref:mitochondrial inner membrane protease ATP23 homolog isoform X2 n=1 Tax=Podarcis muralis TaxID=64176 RepID=UPI00109FB541|nr:mitochondrial inner membrane protease ATP23 homolog isoform X2 [Podarcis muralis]